MDWLGQFISAIAKIAPAPLLAVGIATGAVLFVPDSLAATLGIESFRLEYRSSIGAAFIFSWSYLTAHLLLWVRTLCTASWTRRKNRLLLEEKLHFLTPEEQGYVAPYVLKNVNTQHFPVDDGVIGGLLAKGIVYRSSNMFDLIGGVPYNMQTWAKKYLADHPELLVEAIVQADRDIE